MSDKVVYADIPTRLDLPVERILGGASENDLDSVVVVGWNSAGELYVASSMADGAEILWLLEQAKRKLFEVCE